jgi:hypothetical protein
MSEARPFTRLASVYDAIMDEFEQMGGVLQERQAADERSMSDRLVRQDILWIDTLIRVDTGLMNVSSFCSYTGSPSLSHHTTTKR